MGNPILPRAPLILVLAEVSFSPILSIATKIAEIQEYLRHRGFPEFARAQKESDPEDPSSDPELLWRFGTKNHQTAIVVSNNTLSLETSEYPGFNDFIKTFEQAIDSFLEIAHPNLLESIEFRYVNLIQELGGHIANQLIKPEFMQLSPIPNTKSNYQYESAQFETEDGIIRINLIKTNENLTVPPDIEPAVFIPPEKIKDSERIILDINHLAFFEETDFSKTTVLDTFDRIHRENVRPAFESIATSLAFEVWGKENES